MGLDHPSVSCLKLSPDSHFNGSFDSLVAISSNMCCFYSQEMMKSLDPGMQDSLKEMMTRSLKKLADQADSPVLDIDDTLLK